MTEQLSLFGEDTPEPRRDPYDVLDEAIKEHNPTHVFGLLSGGHDSVCSSFIASQHPRFSGIVHVNTGIGVEETHQYVRDLTSARRWPLLEMYPPTRTYRDIVLDPRWGFPGPAAHQQIYVWLKERTLDKLIREHKRRWKDRILLVSGVRKQESQRRKSNTKVTPVRRDGATVWVNTIFDWSAQERLPFMQKVGLPRNRVVDILHFSGECLDGSKRTPDERELLKAFYPATEQKITDLESEAKEAGVPACRWGERPPKHSPQSQLRLRDGFQPMCVGCPSLFDEVA